MLTREYAAKRSANIQLEKQWVELDLGEIRDPNVLTFGVTTRLHLTSVDGTLGVDAAGASDISVEIDGKPVSYDYLDDRIEIAGLTAGQATRVQIRARMQYSRDGQGLHRMIEADGSVYAYTHFEPNAAHRAWPCIDQPDVKPSWEFAVIAPAGMVVRSNQEETKRTDLGETERICFAPTPPLSSYITAVIAGDYAEVYRDTYRYAGTELQVEPIQMRVLTRQAMAPYMDGAFVGEVTKACLDHYHRRYQFAYPWGKYDQVFVPEYTIGAMENPGCITFNETYIPRDGWYENARERLANTIAHEMAHMWFGDLVTPAWWDDLWLKESFADHEAYAALAAATEFKNSWASFAIARKSWAYTADQAPTTHPIAADIPDVAAAQQNFDGITYAKGAAVLKQLVAWVGEDAFVTALRGYFKKHAWGSATMADLIEALNQQTGTLQGWSRAWIETAGPSLIRVSDKIQIDSVDAVTGEQIERPHYFQYAIKDEADNWQSFATRDGESAQISANNTLVNEDDHTYAIIEYENWDLPEALLDDPETMRQVMGWSALYMGVWRAKYAPQKFVEAVLFRLSTLPSAIVGTLAAYASQYLRGWGVQLKRGQVENLYRDYLRAKAAGDINLAMACLKVLPAACANLGEFVADLADIENTKEVEHRWYLAAAAVAAGAITSEKACQKVADDTARGRAWALQLKAAEGDNKRKVMDAIIEHVHNNEELTHLLEGLRLNRGETTWDAATYLAKMERAWQVQPLHLAVKIAARTLPHELTEIERVLSDTDLPRPLRRAVLEAQDAQMRAEACIEKFA